MSENRVILRHLPQKISKPHFSEIDAPEENPLPWKIPLHGNYILQNLSSLYI